MILWECHFSVQPYLSLQFPPIFCFLVSTVGRATVICRGGVLPPQQFLNACGSLAMQHIPGAINSSVGSISSNYASSAAFCMNNRTVNPDILCTAMSSARSRKSSGSSGTGSNAPQYHHGHCTPGQPYIQSSNNEQLMHTSHVTYNKVNSRFHYFCLTKYSDHQCNEMRETICHLILSLNS